VISSISSSKVYADHLANAGDPDQALRLRRGEHAIAELVGEAANLRFCASTPKFQ
jgi:hypothetical protein